MPRPRFENADPAMKAAILKAATKEFAQRGYDAASLNRIIEASGLSKGSFYYYFDDKADLAAQVIVDATLQSSPLSALDEVMQAKDRRSFWSRMEAYQRRAMQTLVDAPEQVALVTKLGLAYVDHPELAAQVAPLLTQLQNKVLAAFQRGQALGAVRKDLPIPTLLVVLQSVKNGLVSALLRDRPPSTAELERFASLQWDLFLRLLTPGKTS